MEKEEIKRIQEEAIRDSFNTVDLIVDAIQKGEIKAVTIPREQLEASDAVAKVEGNRPKDAMNKNTAFKQLSRLVDAGISAHIRPRSWNKEGKTPYFALEVEAASSPLYTPRDVTDFLTRNVPVEVVAGIRTAPFAVRGRGEDSIEFTVYVPGEGFLVNPERTGSAFYSYGRAAKEAFTLAQLRARRGRLTAPSGRPVIVRLPEDLLQHEGSNLKNS